MERVAALPMYDLPELRGATDAWWGAIAARLSEFGISGVPARLDRGRPDKDVWRDSGLLFGQTCGYPVATFLAERVRVVATPWYRAEGSRGGTYRSCVVVPRASGAKRVADLAESRVAINDRISHSGMNALRALVAPHARGQHFFSAVTETGSHRASLAALREGRADVAAIDAITLALVGDVAPEELEGIRILVQTDSTPCLPYVTAKATSDEDVAVIRRALSEVIADPKLVATRDRLRIEGVTKADASAYAPIRAMEEAAAALGYRHLR